MRIAVVVSFAAMLTGACLSTPDFVMMDSTAPDAATSSIGTSDPTADAAAIPDDDAGDPTPVPDDDASTTDDDASTTTPPPPPPAPTCNPPAGSPAGTQCCGAGATAPYCVGMACLHCDDCDAKNCGAGTVCCAISPGKSGMYKEMACAANGLAGFCPK